MKKTVPVFIWLLFAIACQARIITVDDDGPADFNNIQAAIDHANDGDEIEVAPGTYYEAINFNGKAIRLYSSGGPDGTTIDGTGAYHVVQCVTGENVNTILEGFTITGGDAKGTPGEGHGGGMFNFQSNPNVTNCTFTGNSAYIGGGMCNEYSSPIVTNCTFTGNNADTYDGGGMFNFRSNPKVINCTFIGNTAGKNGGGIGNFESYPFVINCILWGDIPNEILHIGHSFTLTYSDVQGGIDKSWFGTGCIDADPCFVDPGYWDPNGTPEDANDDFWIGGDYHLKSQAGRWNPNSQRWVQDANTSPCIDAGNPLSPIGLEPFPNGGIVNMGVYGGTDEASKSYFGQPVCETIVAGDINGDCRIDFKDFWFMALNWLEDNTPLPGQATNPNPANRADNVDPNTDLSWTAGFGATSHDVYFGTSNPPTFIGNQTSTIFDPGTMIDNTWHYWRIDEVNTGGKTTGTAWFFATGFPPPVPPLPTPP